MMSALPGQCATINSVQLPVGSRTGLVFSPVTVIFTDNFSDITL